MQPENEFDEDLTAEGETGEIEDIESLKESLAETRKEAEENLENWQRTQADFINYKRRSQQEKDEIGQYASTALLCNILPVLDDLERALGSVPDSIKKTPWLDGLKLIERKFNNILESQGVTRIKTRGKAFDPNLHEAMMTTRGKEGMVVRELLKGYRIGDRTIRPAKVAVGSGEE